MIRLVRYKCGELQHNIIRVVTSSTDPHRMSSSDVKKGKSADEDITTRKDLHKFFEPEMVELRRLLLAWYDVHKRDLPWRKIPHDTDVNKRAYAVWVSEAMLQQTQIATVIDYYNRWMKKWPTLEDLAASNTEEVNELWTGLGYYSRGRRLFEGAQKVVKEMNGQMPRTSAKLEKELPGVGRYTAGAISSIALGEVTGVVDGNVIRVLSRLRSIGAHSTQPNVMEALWSLANQIVDPKRPGDFNQSMMELGATVCKPKNPSCSQCPVRKLCSSYARAERDKRVSAARICKSESDDTKPELADIECLVKDCQLCPPSDQPWDKQLGVVNFPRKPKKAEAKQECLDVLVLRSVGQQHKKNSGDEFLICQRPNKGLLAGMWEFLSVPHQASHSELIQAFSTEIGVSEKALKSLVSVGGITHIFSHVHHQYHIWLVNLPPRDMSSVEKHMSQPTKWVTEEDLFKSAFSVGMKKVFKICKDSIQGSGSKSKRKQNDANEDVIIKSPKRKQATISTFFKHK